MTMRSELAEAPAVVTRLLQAARAPLDGVAAEVARRGVDLVVIAARGTSDHAATYAQYVLGERNGLPVALAAPSLASLYGHGPKVGRALVIGISQSGRSPDVVGVIEDGRRQGALTLAITNDPSSPLADAADIVVPLQAGPELAVAATKTYVAELTVVALLSDALGAAGVGVGHHEDQATALAGLPAALEETLGLEDAVKPSPAHGSGSPGAPSSDAATTTPRSGNGRSSSRKWPAWPRIRTRQPTSSTVRSR